EAEEHASTFLGLPLWIWQLVNLGAFLAVLLYFVARPLAAMFRNRQLAVAARLREARALGEASARLGAEVHERMARLDVEIAEIRARGQAEGETERGMLSEKADREVERVRHEAEAEVGARPGLWERGAQAPNSADHRRRPPASPRRERREARRRVSGPRLALREISR